jgi:hypothetical protein
MKSSSRILLSMLIILVAGLLLSNIILKNEYNKIDKSDLYWNYTDVLNQHFKYLKIEGGNNTKIAFEQNKNCSVRVLNDWQRYHPELIKSFVKNDTLFIKFVSTGNNQYEKEWMKRTTLVRIFSPELLFVEGFNTYFEMFKLKQKSINVNITGRSKFEVESLLRSLDSVTISQRDSSEVVFEMSPKYQTTTITDPNRIGVSFSASIQINSKEAMSINSVKAELQGYTLLDLGHAQIDSLQLKIADSSAIILSGGGLRKYKD